MILKTESKLKTKPFINLQGNNHLIFLEKVKGYIILKNLV